MLPFGKAGVVSASILGLGRALGETLAVTIVLSNVYEISWHLTETGGVTFASNIALKYGEAGDIGTGALIASGLVPVRHHARGELLRAADHQRGSSGTGA